MANNLEPNDPMDEYIDPAEKGVVGSTEQTSKENLDRYPEDLEKQAKKGDQSSQTANVEEIYPGGAPHATRPEDMDESGVNDQDQSDQDQSEGTYGPV